MLSNNALRVLATAGFIAACASTQACDPSADDLNVRTQAGLSAKGCAGTVSPSGACLPPTAPGGGAGGAAITQSMPPAGYSVKWTTCDRWIEGSAKLHNNSRVVAVRSDGTVPVHRAEPDFTQGADRGNVKRVKLSNLSKPLKGGTGIDRRTGNAVKFVKLGQVVQTKDPAGNVTQWVIASENLGQPTRLKNGKLSYLDTCYRDPSTAGKDTAGRTDWGLELSATCVVEEGGQDFNALSAYGWKPLENFADKDVGMRNSPDGLPHPDGAIWVKATPDKTINYYFGYGSALNDINGTERDGNLVYWTGENYCHYIVNGGYEVPGAKRPSSTSYPAPGKSNEKSYIQWRPVNMNITVANESETLDWVEPETPPQEETLEESSTLVPL